MDAKVLFWTWAWFNMALALGCAGLGIQRVRHGEFGAHRRLLFLACALVVLFLVAYVGKLALLGREDLDTWQPSYVHLLRVHELCVFLMCVAGGISGYLSLRLGLPDPPEPPAARPLRLHRQLGWTSVSFGLLALATAGYVLWGMYERTA